MPDPVKEKKKKAAAAKAAKRKAQLQRMREESRTLRTGMYPKKKGTGKEGVGKLKKKADMTSAKKQANMPARKKKEQEGYGPQNRIGIAPKVKRKKKDNPATSKRDESKAGKSKNLMVKKLGMRPKKPTAQMMSNYAKRIAAQKLRDKKAADKKKIGTKIINSNEKQRLKLMQAKRKIALKKKSSSVKKKKAMSVAQLRKAGKIQF